MGSNKALLPLHGGVLVQHVALQVQLATGVVTIVGPSQPFTELGFRVVEDRFPDCGPLGGIHAALLDSGAQWSLVVACDLPNVTAEFLRKLIEQARKSPADAVMPVGAGGLPEPLCAVYRRVALDGVKRALESGRYKVTDAFAADRTELVAVEDMNLMANANTPQEWRRILEKSA